MCHRFLFVAIIVAAAELGASRTLAAPINAVHVRQDHRRAFMAVAS
jgi:hypothetical protein